VSAANKKVKSQDLTPFRGRVVRSERRGPFALIETTFAEDAEVPLHSHERPYVSFLLRGSYTEEGPAAWHDCAAGTVIFHPEGETHRDRFHRLGGRVLNLELDREWLRGLGVPLQRRAVALPAAFRAGLQLGDAGDLEELAIEFVGEAAAEQERASLRRPRWLAAALALVDDAVEEGERIALSVAARHCGVHPVHLARTFPRFTGCTFSRYVLRRRVAKALRELERGGAVADAAARCGFADQAHLCRSFKRETGVTPSQFRQR
jgi:AraC family transcriptional regulator